MPPSAYYGPGAEVKKERDATLPALRSAQAGVTGQSPELRSIKPGLRSDHALLGSWPEVQLVRLPASDGVAFTGEANRFEKRPATRSQKAEAALSTLVCGLRERNFQRPLERPGDPQISPTRHI